MQNVNIVADLMQERLIYCNKLSGWERIAPSNVPLRLRFIISFLSSMSDMSELEFMTNPNAKVFGDSNNKIKLSTAYGLK